MKQGGNRVIIYFVLSRPQCVKWYYGIEWHSLSEIFRYVTSTFKFLLTYTLH